jgi:hypothetical protein
VREEKLIKRADAWEHFIGLLKRMDIEIKK